MAKFCSHCGKELSEEQDVCLGCGIAVAKDPKPKVQTGDHSTYFKVTGIIMIGIAVCLFIAGSDVYGSEKIIFVPPALCALFGGIIQLCSPRNKVAVAISALLYMVGGLINLIVVSDISIYMIIASVFAGFNIYFAWKMI